MRLQKLISTALSITTAFTLVGIGGAKAYAGKLTEGKVSMSVVRSGQTSSHTISFKLATAGTLVKKVEIKYRQKASGDDVVPGSFANASAEKGVVTVKGVDDSANWTLDKSVAGTLVYTATTEPAAPGTNDIYTFETTGLSNNVTNAAPACDTVADSDTCWVRIRTLTAADAEIDTTTTTYTVINPITVDATVDPILTFTVAGVNTATTNDANQGGATSVTTTSTTIPFGNVTLGTAKTAQQQLNVLTNANNGYNVYAKFLGTDPALHLMTGTYSGNNIDPISGGAGFLGTGWTEDGAGNAPGTWTTPTGAVKNENTAWLGMRSNNAGLAGFTADKWSPPYVGTAIGKMVMKSLIPDNGTTPTYVSYKIQANAFQPADLYTGTLVYNVVASY